MTTSVRLETGDKMTARERFRNVVLKSPLLRVLVIFIDVVVNFLLLMALIALVAWMLNLVP